MTKTQENAQVLRIYGRGHLVRLRLSECLDGLANALKREPDGVAYERSCRAKAWRRLRVVNKW